ncbi:hypothetical protein [Ichthyenterobacterium magnum]|uniref:Uncharacterized protein n=1 Tax=Ichthyenterobacterium magnum TaxID=1230530 RepID=A0A420DH13_9FLAO|nr:hypothetical protein [Ichthyenterobacterium magnum]RKE92373.1 hypothetical protein BXY80_2292 [Ichthyenterobacterium magnum]
MKDKYKFTDYFIIFIMPLLSIIGEYFIKTLNLKSFYQYAIYYVIGVFVFYIGNLIRKNIFGIYFNTKD